MNVIILFLLLAILITISVPIGIALGMATLIVMATMSNVPLVTISQNAFAALDSFPLMAIPFFILAGNLMEHSGISKRLLDFADSLVGFITGGLSVVTILTSMFFAAISGSGPATVSAIGTFMIPAMEEEGYDPAFAAALTSASGSIGVIIPPSIPFVIYAVAVGGSITDLFIAGIIPGILIGFALIITSCLIAKKHGWKGDGKKFSISEVFKRFRSSFWALLMPVIILGSIYKSIATPTEAAIIGVVYAVIVGRYVYKELELKDIYTALKDTATINGATSFMVGLSSSFAAYLTMEQIPVKIATSMLSLTDNATVIMLLILVFLLIVGCFIDNISSCIILAPIFLPIAVQSGFNVVHFGVIMTVALSIGFVTPPYGANLFVASGISGVSIERISKRILPLIIAMVIVLLLVTFIPAISMTLVQK